MGCCIPSILKQNYNKNYLQNILKKYKNLKQKKMIMFYLKKINMVELIIMKK